MTTKNLIIVLSTIICIASYAQEKSGTSFSGKTTGMYKVPSLQSRKTQLIPADNSFREIKDKRHFGNRVIIGKDAQKTDDYYLRNRHPKEQSKKGAPPRITFDAVNTGGSPSDPDIAIGPDHVFVVYNTGFRIFDKQGNPLIDPMDDSNLFTNNDTCCDLTVSYDNAADRWVVAIISAQIAGNSDDLLQIAVSDGPDPVNAGWNVYEFSGFLDYQKLSVWSDGYYITANTFGTNIITAFERDAMLAGQPTARIQSFEPGSLVFEGGFFSIQALNVMNDDLPAPGGAPFVYLQDDAWSGIASDHIKLWTVDVDWENATNSSITLEPEIPLQPFIGVFDGGSFSNLSQPNGGSALDALQATIMNQAQFRKFDTHNSAVFNFVVDTDASAAERAGIRWVELRQTADNQPWSLHQEGTYVSPDGKHAWNGSIAINSEGSIGLAYTGMSGPTTSSTVFVSSYYTGRLATDPTGTMTITEELISQGTANIFGTRYGDYAKTDVDPSDKHIILEHQ